MPDLSRRTALTALLGAPLLIAGCSVATPSPSPSAVPTGSAAPPQDLVLEDGPELKVQTASITVQRFGPTGTHWPARTPTRKDRFAFVVEADPTWSSIAAAIERANAVAPNGNAAILVRPGTLPGFGAGSTAKPVLSNVGSARRKTRVLISPRDGVGSVTFSASIRLDRVRGVTFLGFWLAPYSLVLSAVQDFSWAWSKGQAFNITGNSSEPTADVDLVECVTPEARAADGDTWAFRTAGQRIDRVAVIGSYIAPSYKAAGSSAHVDTLQLSGSEGMSGIVFRDTAIFASTNAAFIGYPGASDILFDSSLVVGGRYMLDRFPLPEGANNFTSGYPSAVNGSGTVDILSASGSTFYGPLRGTWKTVSGSTVIGAQAPSVADGAFDAGATTMSADGFDTISPVPTDDVLRSIWK